MKTIVIAVGDVGSWSYIRGLLDQLSLSMNIQLLVDPKGAARKEIEKAGVAHTVWDGGPIDLRGVDAVFCGTAGKAMDLWLEANRSAVFQGITVAWFGDYVGSGLEAPVEGLVPNHALLFDAMTAKHFSNRRRHAVDSGACRVQVVGNPSFDEISSFDVAAARSYGRKLLALRPEDVLIVYSGSSSLQFDLENESLRLQLDCFGKKGPEYKFGARFHPADPQKERFKAWVAEEFGDRFIDLGELQGLALAAAADFYITDYSTEGFKACLLGILVAFVMGVSAKKYQLDQRGLKAPFFPILEGSDAPAIGVFDGQISTLEQIFGLPRGEVLARIERRPDLKILRDGHAGERVLAAIKEIVG